MNSSSETNCLTTIINSLEERPGEIVLERVANESKLQVRINISETEKFSSISLKSFKPEIKELLHNRVVEFNKLSYVVEVVPTSLNLCHIFLTQF